MTFDDDLVQLEFDGGIKRIPCARLGLEWPPPEHIEFMGIPMTRDSMSSISDEDRADMDHVCRGARYIVRTDQP
jgi:hypothetical protein